MPASSRCNQKNVASRSELAETKGQAESPGNPRGWGLSGGDTRGRPDFLIAYSTLSAQRCMHPSFLVIATLMSIMPNGREEADSRVL